MLNRWNHMWYGLVIQLIVYKEECYLILKYAFFVLFLFEISYEISVYIGFYVNLDNL